jgi:hypothetical protein
MKRESRRPLFFLVLALMGWIMTFPALLAPSQTVSTYSTYTETGAGANYIISQQTTTLSTGLPTPKADIYTFMIFYAPVVMIFGLLLLLYYINWFKRTANIGVDDFE